MGWAHWMCHWRSFFVGWLGLQELMKMSSSWKYFQRRETWIYNQWIEFIVKHYVSICFYNLETTWRYLKRLRALPHGSNILFFQHACAGLFQSFAQLAGEEGEGAHPLLPRQDSTLRVLCLPHPTQGISRAPRERCIQQTQQSQGGGAKFHRVVAAEDMVFVFIFGLKKGQSHLAFNVSMIKWTGHYRPKQERKIRV